jgi:hypothetical protein
MGELHDQPFVGFGVICVFRVFGLGRVRKFAGPLPGLFPGGFSYQPGSSNRRPRCPRGPSRPRTCRPSRSGRTGPSRSSSATVLSGMRHLHFAHVGHAVGAHRHVAGRDLPIFLATSFLRRRYRSSCRGPWRSSCDAICGSGSPSRRATWRRTRRRASAPTGMSMLTSGQRLRADPAAVGAGHLEVVAVHVDRVVGHGQVADADADLVVEADTTSGSMPGKTRLFQHHRLKSVISMTFGT